MKHFLGLSAFLFASIAGAQVAVKNQNYHISCGATLNGQRLKLVETKEFGQRYAIDVNDPNFEKVDVMIDVAKPGAVRMIIGRFVTDEELVALRKVMNGMDPSALAIVKQHLQARSVHLNAGYRDDETALIDFRQGDLRLQAACQRELVSP